MPRIFYNVSLSKHEFFSLYCTPLNMDNLKSLSKSCLNKCGDVISNCNRDCFEFIQAVKIVSDWRALHLGPLNEVRSIVKRRLQN